MWLNEEYFAQQDNQAQPFMQLPIQGDAQEMEEGQVDIALPEDKEVMLIKCQKQPSFFC